MESPACDRAWPPWDRLRELIAGGLRFERTPRPGEGERSEPDQPGIARAPGLGATRADRATGIPLFDSDLDRQSKCGRGIEPLTCQQEGGLLGKRNRESGSALEEGTQCEEQGTHTVGTRVVYRGHGAR